MPPVPKKKHTKARTGKREAGKRKLFDFSSLTPCPSCGVLRHPHQACKACGYTYTKN